MFPQRWPGGSLIGQPGGIGQNRWRPGLAQGCGPPIPMYLFDTSAAD